jgi:hypothetical protein
MSEEPSDLPERKERTTLWVTIAGGAGAAAIGAVIAGAFNYVSHQYDLDAKVIELGVGILRAPVTEETKPLREWAIDVMGKRAHFYFDEKQRAVLLNQPLPFRSSDWEWEPIRPNALYKWVPIRPANDPDKKPSAPGDGR